MVFVPGENWIICDISGKKILQSKSRKTWDGLRVAPEFWSPKHPQLSIKPIRERMAVYDGRPQRADIWYEVPYGIGSFCLISSNGTRYVCYAVDDGALLVREGTWGNAIRTFYLGQYGFRVADDGALYVTDAGSIKGPLSWKMYTVNGLCFELTVDLDLAVHLTLVTVPEHMNDGTFTLISPGGFSYSIYITDDGAVIAVLGTYGQSSSHFYLGTFSFIVEDDGAVLVRPSGEIHVPVYRMVSPSGIEYLLTCDPDGAVKIGREGHWWNVPSIVATKTQAGHTVNYPITESSDLVWEEE